MRDATPQQTPVLNEAELVRALDELAELVEIVCSCSAHAHAHAHATAPTLEGRRD